MKTLVEEAKRMEQEVRNSEEEEEDRGRRRGRWEQTFNTSPFYTCLIRLLMRVRNSGQEFGSDLFSHFIVNVRNSLTKKNLDSNIA